MYAIDYSIIFIYFCLLIFVGILLRRKAGNNIQNYFLGGRNIPWWMLGVSGMVSNLDITGTMLISSLFYVLGVKGFLVEIRGGVVLILAFMMIFLGKWHRRSGVMTLAEWMEFRFGDGKQGRIAHLFSMISILFGTVSIIGYFFVGIGKFLSIFLPFPPIVCALAMIAIALIYTTMSGLLGVVYTDVLQACLIVFTTIFISVKAFTMVDPATLAEITPAGWSNILPSWKMDLPSNYEMYNLFGIAVIFYFLKTIIEGMGTSGAYMAQRFFAAKSDRDCGLLSLLWISLLSFRWPFIIGVAVLGLSLGSQVAEPEMVLPTVLVQFIPTGLKGLIVASLIAAAMSTFDSTVNAAASYLVNDIYLKYMKPDASQKQLIRASYVASITIVTVGILIGITAPSINSIWGWITMSLVAGMLMPNLMRWYWWRLNGYGYAIGTGVGIVGAILQTVFFPSMPEWEAFIFVAFISLVGMIVSTLLTQPTEQEILSSFYKQTRPFGFWKKISQQIDSKLIREIKSEHFYDLISLIFAIPWQIALFLVPTFIIIHKWNNVFVFSSILIVSSIGLYFFWFKKLSKQSD